MYPQVNCARHSLQAGTGGKGEVVKTKKRPNVVVVVVGTRARRPAGGRVTWSGRGRGGDLQLATCNLQEVLVSEKRTVMFTITLVLPAACPRHDVKKRREKRLVRLKAFTKRRGETAKSVKAKKPKEVRRLGKVAKWQSGRMSGDKKVTRANLTELVRS